MRKLNRIIIHCSATKPHIDIGADVIRDWHVNDNGWDDIGYHKVIRRDGMIEDGRPVEQTGAHTQGENHDSVGICMVGGTGDEGNDDCNFTVRQWEAIDILVNVLISKHGNMSVHGHREFSSKSCPTFDVRAWWGDKKSNRRVLC